MQNYSNDLHYTRLTLIYSSATRRIKFSQKSTCFSPLLRASKQNGILTTGNAKFLRTALRFVTNLHFVLFILVLSRFGLTVWLILSYFAPTQHGCRFFVFLCEQ